MRVDPDTIQTKEVLDWKGLHLLNFSQSSCSQKVRILLSEKGLTYRSREVDLKALEHTKPWYLGINARGVVPVLVDGGDVHIESNDILAYLEERYPSEHSWIPEGAEELQIASELLALEERLHTHLRSITMGFMAPKKMMEKSEAELDAYLANGPDDPYRLKQVQWWQEFRVKGITSGQAQDAVRAFYSAFSRLDELLADRDWLVAHHPTIADIAWFINLHRLALSGYPLTEHLRVDDYYRRMLARPAFQNEISKGPLPLRFLAPVYRAFRRLSGTNLKPVFASVFVDRSTDRLSEIAS
ncbi:MAG: glutathione S-transferase family protein [Pseudomonadota bacterium]